MLGVFLSGNVMGLETVKLGGYQKNKDEAQTNQGTGYKGKELDHRLKPGHLKH